MEKVTAEWSAELWVHCPHCKEYQDVKVLEIDCWHETFDLTANQEDIGWEYTCTNEECKKEFIIDKTEW